MGKKKVVLDSNILVSAFGWRGNPHKIFQRVVDGEFELMISAEQLTELTRVLDYPKFSFSEDQKKRFLTLVWECAAVAKISGKFQVILDDPDDDVILETALVSGADIVTGDPHLLNLKEYKGVKIYSAAEFLEKFP